MDFLVKTDLGAFPQSIDFNFEEIKSELEEKLIKYKNLVVTEDGIKAAKADKAKLNKLVAAIEDKRKEIKSVCLAPYNNFEAQCKELVSLIKAPVIAIDTQIKEFEEIKKQEKYNELKTYFNENVKELAEIVLFDKILNPKWANVTIKTDTLKNEIGDTIDRIREELATINDQYSDVSYKSAILSEYCKNYDLSKTLVYAAQLKKETEIQAKALNTEKSKPVQPTVISDTRQVIPGMEKDIAADSIGTASFRVVCTRSQIISLMNFMRNNGIKFETIKKEKEVKENGSK